MPKTVRARPAPLYDKGDEPDFAAMMADAAAFFQSLYEAKEENDGQAQADPERAV